MAIPTIAQGAPYAWMVSGISEVQRMALPTIAQGAPYVWVVQADSNGNYLPDLNWVNARDYGASPTNTAAQNDAAFAAAISALGGPGTVLIPAGTYAYTGITLSSLTDVSLMGTGPGTILAPTSGNTAITTSGCTRCQVRNLKIDGSINGAARGINCTGNFDGRFQNLHIVGCSGDAILTNGDAAGSMELYLNSITCRNNGGYAYHHVRTTATDNGGCYITNFKANYDSQGLGGINIDASAVASTVSVHHFFTDCIVDGYSGHSALQLHNTNNVRFEQLWCGGTLNSGPMILIDGDGFMNEINQGWLDNGGTGAGTYIMTIAGTQHDNDFDAIDFVGGGTLTACVHVTSTGADNRIGFYNIFGSVNTLTDTASALYARGSVVQQFSSFTIEAAGTNTASSFGVDDPSHPGNQKWLRNSNGSFQIVNTAFSSTIFRVDDGGFVFAGGGVMPFGNNTGACTLYSGSGAPAVGVGATGDYYFRSDTPGTANQRIYVKSAGAWVGIL